MKAINGGKGMSDEAVKACVSSTDSSDLNEY